MALLDPPLPLLEKYLTYSRIGFEEGGPLGYQERAEHGYQVELVDHRKFGAGFAVDKEFLKLRSDEECSLLAAVRREPLGQIEVSGRRDVIAKTDLILGMYPDAHALLPVGTRSQARRTLQACRRDFEDIPMRFLGGELPEKPARCAVCTSNAIYTRPVTEYEIVLLLDPSGAVGERNCRPMGTLLGPWDVEIHRVYTFIPPGIRLGRCGRLRLEAMSGPVVHRLEPQHAAVGLLRIVAGESLPLWPFILARRSTCCWR